MFSFTKDLEEALPGKRVSSKSSCFTRYKLMLDGTYEIEVIPKCKLNGCFSIDCTITQQGATVVNVNKTRVYRTGIIANVDELKFLTDRGKGKFNDIQISEVNGCFEISNPSRTSNFDKGVVPSTLTLASSVYDCIICAISQVLNELSLIGKHLKHRCCCSCLNVKTITEKEVVQCLYYAMIFELYRCFMSEDGCRGDDLRRMWLEQALQHANWGAFKLFLDSNECACSSNLFKVVQQDINLDKLFDRLMISKPVFSPVCLWFTKNGTIQ